MDCSSRSSKSPCVGAFWSLAMQGFPILTSCPGGLSLVERVRTRRCRVAATVREEGKVLGDLDTGRGGPQAHGSLGHVCSWHCPHVDPNAAPQAFQDALIRVTRCCRHTGFDLCRAAAFKRYPCRHLYSRSDPWRKASTRPHTQPRDSLLARPEALHASARGPSPPRASPAQRVSRT